VAKARSGDAKELCRWMNWQPRAFAHTSELTERHRQNGTLPDDAARDFAIWVAVGCMRNLAVEIIGEYGEKSLALRRHLCTALEVLLGSGPIHLAGYDDSLWSEAQLQKMRAVMRELALRLLLALWDASPQTLRRLRRCRYPNCRAPWFIDESTRRPCHYCKRSHRVRTAEDCAPLRKAVLEVLKRGQQNRWITDEKLEQLVGPSDPYLFSTAMQGLVAEGKVKFREVRPPPEKSRKVNTGPVDPLVALEVTQYRLA